MRYNDILVCPVCQHKNRADAAQCVQCGVSLLSANNKITINVGGMSDQQVEAATTHMTATHRHGLLNDGVVLYVAGEIRPLILRGRRRFVLGRHLEDRPSSVVDMTRFHGHLLGVSRRHAVIRQVDGEYLIEDLNSTNGTWLNERRLAPHSRYIVTNGDQIRLGQLIMYVYFAGPSTRQRILLQDRSSGVAPDLDARVTPFADAIVGVQSVIDTVLGREAHPAVSAIDAEPDSMLVAIHLEGAMDAVQLVRDVVTPWKREHRDAIVQARRMQMAERLETDERRLLSALQHDLTGLAGEMLSQVVADVGAAGGSTYIAQMLFPLQTLVFSPLELADSMV